MEDTDFDDTLVAAAFNQAALTGWRDLSIVDAARSAGLPLDRARRRFPGPGAVLMRFGLMADTAALAETVTESLPRARLFDLLMRRIDVLQAHRPGMLALLSELPLNPALSLGLTAATLRSMGWMLEAAGISAAGLRGRLRANALLGVWLYAVRAWRDDESVDLASTMAATDKALDTAERVLGMVGDRALGELDDALEGVVDVPESDLPADVPVMDVPAMDVPVTDVPVVDVPGTGVPETGGSDAPDRLTTLNPPPPPAEPPPPSP